MIYDQDYMGWSVDCLIVTTIPGPTIIDLGSYTQVLRKLDLGVGMTKYVSA